MKTMPIKEIDFKSIFETVPGLYLVLDPDFIILTASDAYLAATMTKREEIAGRHLFEVFPDNPNDKNADGVSNLRASLMYVLENKKPHHMEVQKYDIRRPDGSFEERFWSPINKPVLDEQGQITYIVHRVEDVTSLVKMESSLKESEDKFEKAFYASSAAISIIRLSDTTFVDANNAFLDLIGFTREEVIGHTSIDLNIVVDKASRESSWQEIRTQGVLQHREVALRHKSGAIIHVLSSVETIHHNGERFAISIIYDITRRKVAEEKLEAINQELEAFTYSVSHDLRAPLRAINGFAMILEEDFRDKLGEEGKRQLAVIRENAEKMGFLIDDLLAFSRLGRKELKKNLVNMDELVKVVIKETREQQNNRAEFIVHPLHPVMADYGLMTQVMLNLVNNAVKYSSKKEQAVVEISSVADDHWITYKISDNGVGFDMRYVNKLFGVFQRLHKDDEFPGTGVGLAIVQRIVKKHGGKIRAEGKLNEGAEFFITLPHHK